ARVSPSSPRKRSARERELHSRNDDPAVGGPGELVRNSGIDIAHSVGASHRIPAGGIVHAHRHRALEGAGKGYPKLGLVIHESATYGVRDGNIGDRSITSGQ